MSNRKDWIHTCHLFGLHSGWILFDNKLWNQERVMAVLILFLILLEGQCAEFRFAQDFVYETIFGNSNSEQSSS